MNNQLTKDIDASEVEYAIFKMHGLGSLGLDGFPTFFYQNNWPVVGIEVCSAVQEACQSAKWPSGFNATYITLIPKVKNPRKVTEFRSISLCNVIYKILAKVMENRLKKFLLRVLLCLEG